jgi:hypothetical protein
MTARETSETHDPAIDETPLAMRRSLLVGERQALSRRLVDLLFEGPI